MEAPHAPPSTSLSWSNVLKKPLPTKPQESLTVNRIFPESCKSSLSIAVVDANAIIQGGEKLMNCADKLVSVHEVLQEVRDPISRHRLAVMPFSVEAMEPSLEALKKVIDFARATGDLQTLSDVDLKLIALSYTLETQIHGTKHLRDSPPPLNVVNVKRLPEKELPGWGSNVPNLAEWEAIEHAVESNNSSDSRILPLKDLNMNAIAIGNTESADNRMENCSFMLAEGDQEATQSSIMPRRFSRPKKEVNVSGKKMVADGVDASLGEEADNCSDWMPAVGRSTHRRYLRRKARREMSQELGIIDHTGEMALGIIDNTEDMANRDVETSESIENCTDGFFHDNGKGIHCANEPLETEKAELDSVENDEISLILKNMSLQEVDVDNIDGLTEGDEANIRSQGLDELEISSQTDESIGATVLDDSSSEQSWMLRSLSESSVACVTSDFAMQNVILQMGLRLLAPGGVQIHQLQRWILKCHACNKVTTEIGRIFCPKCGNGGTLRKVSVTVNENGIVLAARRPRIVLRGTKFSLPLPQGGRDAITKNLILREDQLPHKVLHSKSKKKSNKEDSAFLCSDDIFSSKPDKRASLKPPIHQALAVFSGRRNPNDNHFSRQIHKR